AEAAQVLRGEKRIATRGSHRASAASLILGANSLSRIFNDGDMMLLGDFENGIHLRALSEEMNRNYRLGCGTDFVGNRVGSQIESDWVDIYEYRLCSKPGNRAHRSKKSERSRNHFVTRPDV